VTQGVWIVILVFLSTLCALAIWWALHQFPDPPSLPLTSVRLLDRKGRLLRLFTTPDGYFRLPAHLNGIDPDFVHALLTIEDRRFYSHHGSGSPSRAAGRRTGPGSMGRVSLWGIDNHHAVRSPWSIPPAPGTFGKQNFPGRLLPRALVPLGTRQLSQGNQDSSPLLPFNPLVPYWAVYSGAFWKGRA